MASVLRPDPELVLPPWPSPPQWDDQVGAARGICWSVLFALPFWMVMAVLAWSLLR